MLGKISVMDLDGGNVTVITEVVGRVMAVDYDSVNRYVYFTELYNLKR